jgi:hypothetical protein
MEKNCPSGGETENIFAWINEPDDLWLRHAGLVINRLHTKDLYDFRQRINEPKGGPKMSIRMFLNHLRKKCLLSPREMIRDSPSLKHSSAT